MTIIICGFDMTSAPCRRKPITLAMCRLESSELTLMALEPLQSVEALRQCLADARSCRDVENMGATKAEAREIEAKKIEAGNDLTGNDRGKSDKLVDASSNDRSQEWIAGLDFPFGQAREFLMEARWPLAWAEYVRHAAGFSKEEFAQSIYDVMARRSKGNKLIRRITDVSANAISPMSLAYVPVGRMFHVLAPVIEASGASVVPVRMNGDSRVLLEAYPALLARAVLGKRSYKDGPPSQAALRAMNRADLLEALPEHVRRTTGLSLSVPPELLSAMREDSRGDYLDALLCAIQAAHARSLPEWGMPQRDGKAEEGARLAINEQIDIMRQTEGWILGTGVPELVA